MANNYSLSLLNNNTNVAAVNFTSDDVSSINVQYYVDGYESTTGNLADIHDIVERPKTRLFIEHLINDLTLSTNFKSFVETVNSVENNEGYTLEFKYNDILIYNVMLNKIAILEYKMEMNVNAQTFAGAFQVVEEE